MGQITQPAAPGIAVIPVDRQSGPSAGAGNTGNDVIFLGGNAGNNNTGDQSIAIGNSALSKGNTTAGVIAIGAGAGANLTGNSHNYAGVDIYIGTNAANSAQVTGGNVFIGNDVLRYAVSNNTYTQNIQSVVIGAECVINVGILNGGGIGQSNVIGYQVGGPYNNSMHQALAISNSNVIGAFALKIFSTQTNYSPVDQSDIIGYQALPNLTGNATGVIAIGQNVGTNVTGTHSSQGLLNTVMIGAGISVGNGTTEPNYAVAIGESAIPNQNSVTIGWFAGNAGGSATQAGVNSIMIGCGAGKSGVTPNWTFLIESFDTVSTTKTMMYGQMDSGNLSIGNLPYADRDFTAIACTNALKLTNGTRGAGNPLGGGFFYCSAGALHWVGTSGTDTTIAPA